MADEKTKDGSSMICSLYRGEIVGHVIADFMTAFQFLTRIHLMKQTQWSEESFGRGVKFFPVVGGIIGLLLAALVYGFQIWGAGKVSPHLLAVSVIALEITLTGGLHYDGLMDTMDGIFSGRSRERMLEIMKDSRVGSFGVISFCLVILLKYSLLMDIVPELLPVACLTAPIGARMAIVMGILLFPYARSEGLGIYFRKYSEPYALCVAVFFTFLMVLPLGIKSFLCIFAGLGFSYVFAHFVTIKLGGLTGDVYGAVAELTQAVILFAFIIL